MSDSHPSHKVRCYRVTGWEPPAEDAKSKWGTGHNFGVVARSAAEAMKLIQEKHPAVRIDAVNDTCIVHYVIDLHAPSEV